MSSDEDGVGAGQQPHDIALTVLGVVGVSLTVLLLLGLFAPPEVEAWFEPVIRLFVGTLLGFRVWQIVVIVVLAVGSWLLVVDIRTDQT